MTREEIRVADDENVKRFEILLNECKNESEIDALCNVELYGDLNYLKKEFND